MRLLKSFILALALLGFSVSAVAQSGGDSQTVGEKMKQLGKQIGMAFLYPPKQPFPKTPADYGYVYEDVEFKAFDGITLSGWLLNPKAEKTIIMTHFGYMANRYGYQTKHLGQQRPYDKEIEFVKVAGRLIGEGYSVLMYDMRNHGISSKSKKGVGTGGIEESDDVLGAVRFVATYPATKGKPIGLLSYCMGANATFIAYGKHSELFDKYGVKALVAMQPLTNELYLKTLKLPQPVFESAKAQFESVSGHDFHAPVVMNARRITVPTILLQGKRDPNTDMDFVKAVFNSITKQKELVLLEETQHRFDGYNYLYDYPEKMVNWFNKHVKL